MNCEGSTGLSCPNCGWNDVRVSYHARFWDRALVLLFLVPLRCRKCRNRFYRLAFMVRRGASSEAPEVEMRSALPVMTSPRMQPASAVPLAAPLPVVPFPVVPFPVVPFPAAVVAFLAAPFPAAPFPVAAFPVVPFQDAEAPPLSQSLAVPAETTLVTTETPAEIPAETPPQAIETTPPTVLLVDEDAAMRRMLAMLLNREGYTVRHAADSGEAIAELSANGIDVVVANLNDDEQPVVIRKWRSAHPKLSIIALSSGMETKVSLNGTPESNLLTLPLPSRPRNVVQAVRALLDLSRIEASRIGPSRAEASHAMRCAPPSFAHTPRTATG